MTTANAKQCAHPSCSCEAQPGKEFCSDNCRSPESAKAGECQCGHAGCGQGN